MSSATLDTSRSVAAVLLVEDNPADARLAIEAVKQAEIPLEFSVVDCGEDALSFLRQEGDYVGAALPDMILLDLNLPGKDGAEVLREVKSDPDLKHLPVIIMTTSESDADVRRCYGLHANGYVTKPLGLTNLGRALQALYDFWYQVARLPGPSFSDLS